jgi:glycerophosphoryl diester phosphodiesterase
VSKLTITEWISHRGYKKAAAENTLEAFRAAVAQGFRVIETDLHVTADGHIVLAHDPSFERLCGHSQLLTKMTKQEISKLRFARGESPVFFNDFIEDFMHEFKGGLWVFDIKPATSKKCIDLLALWSKKSAQRKSLLSATRYVVWSDADEAYLRAKIPEAVCFAKPYECYRAGLAVLAKIPALGAIKPGRIYSLTSRLGPCSLFNTKIVKAYHKRGAKVLAFLPESAKDTQAALAAEFDIILTNRSIEKKAL